MPNYNSTQVGVPYVRAHKVEIYYPDNNRHPSAIISQKLAVKLADGSIRSLENLPDINVTFDMLVDGTTPVPIPDPTTGAPLGMNTTLQSTMLSILAIIRKYQPPQD